MVRRMQVLDRDEVTEYRRVMMGKGALLERDHIKCADINVVT